MTKENLDFLIRHIAKPETVMSPETDHQVLIELLDKAEQLTRQFSCGYSGQILSAEEFYAFFAVSITKLKSGDNSQLGKLNIWFYLPLVGMTLLEVMVKNWLIKSVTN